MNAIELHKRAVEWLRELGKSLPPDYKFHLVIAHESDPEGHMLVTERHIPEIIDKLRELMRSKRTLVREDPVRQT